MDKPGRKIAPWGMLVSRTLLFASLQALLALVFSLTRMTDPWGEAANWWPLIVTGTNLICLVLLIRLFHQEGRWFWDIFQFQNQTIKTDFLVLLGILVLLIPVALLPNILLANWLFEDPQTPLRLLVRPLPMWIAITSMLIFPVTQGLAEIPTYFSYVMPSLEKTGLPTWLAVTLPSLFLGIQHCAIPLLFNLPFFLWRLFMFIPFAFLLGIVLHWRPRILPYLVVIHILMDASFALMLLGTAN